MKTKGMPFAWLGFGRIAANRELAVALPAKEQIVRPALARILCR
jgi:hypothetical protein